MFVSLGILKVASSLEAAGHKVNLLDLSGVANFIDPLREYIRSCTDNAVGITTTTPQLPSVFKIARAIRLIRPDLRIILGGPHVTLCISALKMERKLGRTGRAARAVQQLEDVFDVIVSGDGEHAIFEALSLDAPKLIDADDPKSPLWLTNKGFTDAPIPARHLVELSSYRYSIDGFPATSLVAQLGCPFACGFCGGRNSKSLRVIRNRSVQSILDEIEHLHTAHGYTGFMFYDDELNVSKSLVEMLDGLTDLQMRLGVAFRLRGFIKSELFTQAQAKAMYRAGFRWLLCGFEAANERILTNIDKRATLADNTKAVQIAKAAGLKIKALMSVGHPGETPGSIWDIRNWLVEMEVDDFDCTVITTYPGTPYYDLAVETSPGIWTYTHPKTGDRLHSYDVDYSTKADYYKGDPNGGYKAYVYTDYLTAEQIVSMRDLLEANVRGHLIIPFNPGQPALRYEHSMGQGLPAFIHQASA